VEEELESEDDPLDDESEEDPLDDDEEDEEEAEVVQEDG
jgi:hypothetical protein